MTPGVIESLCFTPPLTLKRRKSATWKRESVFRQNGSRGILKQPQSGFLSRTSISLPPTPPLPLWTSRLPGQACHLASGHGVWLGTRRCFGFNIDTACIRRRRAWRPDHRLPPAAVAFLMQTGEDGQTRTKQQSRARDQNVK